MWDIVSFVRLPALLFGAGTAIGELPPYFVGRAAALSGMAEEVGDEDFQDFQDTSESCFHVAAAGWPDVTSQ